MDDNEQLRIIKGSRELKSPVSPMAMARLLFEEGKELARDRLLPAVVSHGFDTGYGVCGGRRTIRFNELCLPGEISSAIVVAETKLATGEIYDHKSQERQFQLGILLLGTVDGSMAHWVWSQVWMPYLNDQYCEELNLETLADLMTPSGEENKPTLYAKGVYSGYERMLRRKYDTAYQVKEELWMQAHQAGERLYRIG
ncbi:MAG: hypothetical protein NTV39_02625 [Candidatus Saccharibacteria bacterium]|nr:hypothetical protein [Candidatus Saccharibacteria bacterium]